jgi:hypothetical protein
MQGKDQMMHMLEVMFKREVFKEVLHQGKSSVIVFEELLTVQVVVLVN